MVINSEGGAGGGGAARRGEERPLSLSWRSTGGLQHWVCDREIERGGGRESEREREAGERMERAIT